MYADIFSNRPYRGMQRDFSHENLFNFYIKSDKFHQIKFVEDSE